MSGIVQQLPALTLETPLRTRRNESGIRPTRAHRAASRQARRDVPDDLMGAHVVDKLTAPFTKGGCCPS